MRIKVCGLTQIDQVYELDEIGITFGGFIFYPNSPRFVYNHLQPTDIRNLKVSINKVGVFVNASEDEIKKAVDECGLYLVQLHGDETPHFCEKISNYISVIKVFRISDKDELNWTIKDFTDVADIYLFDTAAKASSITGGNTFGGTGKHFNWDILKGKKINKPYMLSGGIAPEDITDIKFFRQDIVASDLLALDINSRFEILPGIKDISLIKKFYTSLNYH
jgi:phosphoribosylanthranilate isomerase